MARQKLDPHDINRVKTENPASLRSDCPACSGMRVQLAMESLSSFAGIRTGPLDCRLRRFRPCNLYLAMLCDTVSQVKIDKALVRHASFQSHVFEIGYDIFREPHRD